MASDPRSERRADGFGGEQAEEPGGSERRVVGGRTVVGRRAVGRQCVIGHRWLVARSNAAELERGAAQARQRGWREPRDRRSGRATGPRGHPGERSRRSAVPRHATLSGRAAAVSRFATVPWHTAALPRRFHASAGRAGAALSRYADPSGRAARAISGASDPVSRNAGASSEFADRRRLAHAVSDTARVTGPVAILWAAGHAGDQPGPASRRRGDHQPDPDDSQPARTGGGSGHDGQPDGFGHCRRGKHRGEQCDHDLQ